MRRHAINEEVAEINNKPLLEKWKKESDDGFICTNCGIFGVYLPKSKRMICDCKDSPKPASEKMIEFYK